MSWTMKRKRTLGERRASQTDGPPLAMDQVRSSFVHPWAHPTHLCAGSRGPEQAPPHLPV